MSAFAERACARGDRLSMRGDLERAQAAYVSAARASQVLAAGGSRQARRLLARACVGLGRVHLARGQPDAALENLRAAREAVADDADALYWEGCARAARGDYAGAEASLTAALALEARAGRPRDGRGEARVQRAGARFRAGDLDGALEDFRPAERLLALDMRGTIAYAALCSARGECSETERLLAPLVDAGLRDPSAIRLLGLAYERRGRPDRAAALYATAIDAADDDRSREGLEHMLERARRAEARALVGEGRFLAAADSLEDCIRLRPEDEALSGALAGVLCKAAALDVATGDLDGARAHRERAGAHRPPRSLLHRGLLEAARGRAQQALALLKLASEQDPDDERTRRAYVLVAALARVPGRASDEIGSCLAGQVAHAGTAPAVASLLAHEGQWSAAADVLLKAGGGASRGLAECLVRAGRLDDLDGRHSGDAGVWLALAELRRGRLPDAERLLTAAPRDRTAWPAVARLCGLRRARTGEWQLAAEHFLRARAVEGGVARPASPAEAVVLVLAGEREVAISLLQSARDEDPADMRVARCLALARFHALGDRQERGGDDRCERAIAAWIHATRDEHFWEEWGISAEQRYGDRIARHALRSARQQIDDRLETLLAGVEGGDAGAGAAAMTGPVALLWRERKAAERLASSGGFPVCVDEAEARIVCGPLLVRERGWQRAFGDFAAKLAAPAAADEDGRDRQLHESLGLDRAARPRDEHAEPAVALMRAFSSLGVAQAMLELDRPKEALRALQTLACPRCAAVATTTPRVCTRTCPDFDALNPGYAGLADKNERLLRDAHDIASRAHVLLGQAAVAAVPLDADTALEHFFEAVSIRAVRDEAADVQVGMAAIVIGRVRALVKSHRLDDAVTLVEAMLHIARASAEPDLRGQLALILTVRGIRAANEQPPRWNDAILDLRRAVTQNPQLHRAVTNLAAVLRGCAMQHVQFGRWEAAERLQGEAVRALDEARKRIAGHAGLAEQLAQARRELDLIRLTRSELG